MTLTGRLQAEVTAAMRARDDARRDAMRMAVTALQYAAKTARRSLSEDEELSVLAREIKTRRESADAFAGGGRTDLAGREHQAVAMLETFMPAQLSDGELADLVHQAVGEAGAASPRDLGKVMKLLGPRIRGRADGRIASERVARELAAVHGSSAPASGSPAGGG